jgi:hypothetical protein
VLVKAASGGVGSAAVQLATAAGARVTAVAGPGSQEHCRELGAAAVVDYTRTDPAELPERFDVVLDCIGASPLRRYRRILARGGRLVSIAPSPSTLALSALTRFLPGPTVRTLFVRPRRADLDELAARADAGALRMPVQETFPLERIADAHRALAERHGRASGCCWWAWPPGTAATAPRGRAPPHDGPVPPRAAARRRRDPVHRARLRGGEAARRRRRGRPAPLLALPPRPRGKAQLFSEAVERGLERHGRGLREAIAARAGDVRGELRAAAAWVLDAPASNQSRMVHTDLSNLPDPLARDLARHSWDALVVPLTEVLQAGAARGEVHLQPGDAGLVGAALLSALQGLRSAVAAFPVPGRARGRPTGSSTSCSTGCDPDRTRTPQEKERPDDRTPTGGGRHRPPARPAAARRHDPAAQRRLARHAGRHRRAVPAGRGRAAARPAELRAAR